MKKLLLLTLLPALCAAQTLTITQTSSFQGTVTVSGCAQCGYTTPYYINFYESIPVTGNNSTNVNTPQIGWACDAPAACAITADGIWDWTIAPQTAATGLFAIMYKGDGAPFTPGGCDGNGGICTGPGTPIAFSNILPVNVSVPPVGATITYGQNCSDPTGNVWAIGTAPRGAVSENGSTLGPNGFWANSLTCGNPVSAINQDNGAKQCWTGGGWKNC